MFNFTDAMHNLIRHIASVCPELAHVDADRMMVAYIQARSPGVHGVFGSCQPLRFEGGSCTTQHRGKTFEMPRIVIEDREILYIVYFALPRFMDLPFESKLTTIFHELYHISPDFNGDIRRFKGKNYAHGHSRKAFNDRLQKLITAYLSRPDSSEQTAFLQNTFADLRAQHRAVIGTRIRPPRPRPV